MKTLLNYLAIGVILLIITLGSFFKIKALKADNARLKSNQELLISQKNGLLKEEQKYKVADSLNAIKVSQLEFTLKEYKQYYAEDQALISQLKSKRETLQKVVTSQLETINTLSTNLTDSVRIDTVTLQADTLKCFDYKSKWTDIKGCIDLKTDSLALQIKNRESLVIAETVTYKRFLGFLWKTKKIKSRQISIVSLNPNTQIINCEYTHIKE
jgi:hypothetical protein